MPIRAHEEHPAAQAALKVGPTQVDDGQWFDMVADQIRSKDGPLVSGLFISLHSDPEPANQLRPLMTAEAPHAGTVCLISGWRPSCLLSQSKIRTSRGPKHRAEPLAYAICAGQQAAGSTPVYHQQTKNLLTATHPF